LTFEEELKRVDAEIRKLKIQFDLYFVGANPKPPTDQRDTLEKTIKKLQTGTKTVGDRFLYNSIVNKFNAFSELWTKSLRAKEEGIRVHPLALRAAHRNASAETGGTNGDWSPSLGHSSRRTGSEPASRLASDSWRISVTRRDDTSLKDLYQKFIAAKDQCGDERKPSFDAFAREIARQTAALKGKADCDSIDFKIYSKDNKVSLRAKPAK
jgi:hypothetical protein